ncbi:hypothetical protein [Paenibacillus alvei]|uniref:Secreted protein n=1 Tax=Paenibacillus alvei TaxID=44250 RepID=A0AAP6ZZ88_PAEAL|nr:hypothetical protein [Paenibacillus alvei]MBG9734865.1 hypothetical protein [Paenibacillus alvei]MBG9744740.1 hypothetical protein [Paenibacillus alvei]MCY9578837.1 hypothetical protein [Paenibacillus alvei]MCY9583893.1 hypothetical protein [Paenibacillus alvei]NOJ69943.1 hypothetical protein [Paenibacillus alvei]
MKKTLLAFSVIAMLSTSFVLTFNTPTVGAIPAKECKASNFGKDTEPRRLNVGEWGSTIFYCGNSRHPDDQINLEREKGEIKENYDTSVVKRVRIDGSVLEYKAVGPGTTKIKVWLPKAERYATVEVTVEDE